jgi:hypothetical protein
VRNVRPHEHGCHLPETQYVPGASPEGGADSGPLEVPPGSIARGTSEGRPTLLTPEVEAHLIASIRAGAFESGAAEAAGIGRRTFVRWMQQGREDDEHGREKSFWHLWRRLTEARAQARATAEVEVRKADPLAWPVGSALRLSGPLRAPDSETRF